MAHKSTAIVLAGMLALAACGLPTPDEAVVNAEPADGTTDTGGGETSPDETGGEPATDDAGGQDGSGDGENSGAIASNLPADIDPQRVSLPFVPAITLPDLSILGESGTVVEDQLDDVIGVSEGLDVVSADCTAEGGELVYQGSDGRSTFFDVDVDGSGVYRDETGATDITIQVNGDGSGTYRNDTGATEVEIVVQPDGSGTYRDLSGATEVLVEVDGSGYGTYIDNSGATELGIQINEDGSGILVDNSGATEVELVVNADGTGTYRDRSGATELLITTAADGSWRFEDGSGATEVELVVNTDGSGSYRDFSGATEVTIVVDADGSGTYSDQSGATDINLTFQTDLGILDPGLVVAGPAPVFAVADRFPPLASLGRFEPPCVTVIRLDANVLFDFDSDQLRPEAAPVVDEVASALLATGKSLEVHGHTDAKGDDAYNQDLSERRAASFAQALTERGVSGGITTIGFGESRPVAANEKADGSDDPAGRQLNRRIEVVIPE